MNLALTAEELVLMRWPNRRLGDSAAEEGELLVDRLPRLLPMHPQASPKAQAAFVLRWSAVVERLNQMLPGHAQLQWEACHESEVIAGLQNEKIQLFPEQLDCLLDGLQRLGAASPPPHGFAMLKGLIKKTFSR